MRTKTEP